MLKTRVMAAAVAVLATVVLTPAGAAFAESVVVRDGSADTWQTFYDPATGQTAYEPAAAGATPNTDITKMKVTHGPKRITLTVDYVDLVKDEAHVPTFREWLRLSGGGGALLTIWVNDSWSRPVVSFWHHPTLDVPWASRLRTRCSGATGRFDYARDTLTAKIPTSCVRSPDWVQFHGDASSGQRDEGGSWLTSFQDNGHTDSSEDRLVAASQYCYSQCHGWTRKLRAD